MADEESVSVDALIIGAGGCGMVAALAAHSEGLTAALLEKGTVVGGNTALSSGSIPAAGSALQAAAGISDCASDFAQDLLVAGGRHDAEILVDRLADISADLIAFLTSEGVALDLITTYRHVGHRTLRLHAPPSRRGADLVADLERALTRHEIPLALGAGATCLMTWDGRVTGAVTDTGRIEARAVVLACNGFGAAPALLATHCPTTENAAYGGAPHSTGDALAWGAELGAATGNMGAYQGHAGLSTKTGSLMTWTVIERGAVIVDGAGQRFGDETLGYSGFADLALSANGPFHMIYDTRIRDDVAAGQPDFAEACEMGVSSTALDAMDLARKINLPANTLSETLTTAGEAACGLRKDSLGRRDWGFGPLASPLCATQIEPALFHTQGGLKVDAMARVLHHSGHPIPGLYAGGGAAMGISGRRGGRGYMSGNGLLSALGLGLIAGRAVARDLRVEDAVHAAAHLNDPTQRMQHGGSQ